MGLISSIADLIPASILPRGNQTTTKLRDAVDAVVDFVSLEGDTAKLRDGRYVAMVRVDGEFFSLLSESEQDQRILAFASVLNGISWPMQIVVYVEPTDLEGYIAGVMEKRAALGDTPLGYLAEAQAALTESLTRNIMAERVVISVWADNPASAVTRAEQLSAALVRAGFSAGRMSGADIAQTLYLCYGHKGKLPIKSPSWRTLASSQGESSKPKGGEGEKVQVAGGASLEGAAPSIRDLILPPAVIEEPGYLDLGGVYAATLVVVDYPERAQNGWLEPVLHFGFGTSVRRMVSIHLDPVPNDKALGELNRKLVDLGVTERAAHRRGLRADVDTEMALEDAEILREDLARGRQRIFDMTFTVTLMSDNLAELREAVTRLKQEAAGFMLILRETYLQQQLGFRSSLPLGVQALRRVYPMPTIPLATTFPFTSGELLDDEGEFWGQNLITGNVVIINPRKRPAAHMLFVAATRSGKSLTLKHLATQALFGDDEDVMIIDPSPAIDYERWTAAVGGSYLRFGAGSGDRINPCEIQLPAGFDPEKVGSLDDELQRPVTNKVAFLKTIFELMAYPDGKMPAVERARLEAPLYAMYEEAGMSDDWLSIVEPGGLSLQPKAKTPPTLKDALRHIREVPELQELAIKLEPYINGTLDMFSGHTNVDLDRRLVVFNVHQLIQSGGAHLQAVAYALVSEAIRNRLAASRRRKLVAVDEAHILFSNKETAKFLSSLYRMAGKQGGRVAIITQSITDLVGDPLTGVSVAGAEEARVCLSQTFVSCFLRNDKKNDLDLIGNIFNITEAEKRYLAAAQPGQALVIADNERALVQVLVTNELYGLVTTRPEEVSLEGGGQVGARTAV